MTAGKDFLVLAAVAERYLSRHSDTRSIIAHHRSVLLIMSVFALLAACSGCTHTTTGYEMKGERIAFVHDGLTTRAEVVETLGVPPYEFEAERTIAYLWEKEGLQGGFSFFGRYHEIGQNHDRWLFCVHFDQTNRVGRHGTTRQLPTESEREAVLKWLENRIE